MSLNKFIQIQGLTDVGCVRTGNEDSFIVQPMGKDQESLNPSNLFEVSGEDDLFLAVSDGMGGAAAGEVASQTGISVLSEFLTNKYPELKGAEPSQAVAILTGGVHKANRSILEKAREIRSRRGMGATMTAVYVKENVMYLLQVGDSRAYVLRDGKLVRITKDQSFVGHLVEMGTITEVQAMNHPQRSVILQALGTQEKVKPDISYLPLCKGDLVLVCSDGLYSEFLPEKLEEHILALSQDDLTFDVKHLIDLAKEAGGKDNITVIGMKVHQSAPIREPGEDPVYLPFPQLDKDNPLEDSQSIFQ